MMSCSLFAYFSISILLYFRFVEPCAAVLAERLCAIHVFSAVGTMRVSQPVDDKVRVDLLRSALDDTERLLPHGRCSVDFVLLQLLAVQPLSTLCMTPRMMYA